MGHYMTPIEIRRKELERITRLEGTQMWKQQQEENKIKLRQEQQEVRELLENYWPWGRPGGGAPNDTNNVGMRNVNLEEMYANEEIQKAKRQAGTVQFGKPGGGAPHLNKSGHKQIRFREDPALRFQWTEDLRRTVDNTLRYRSKREEQEIYKKQLDALVEEKIRTKQKEQKKKIEFERNMGWTSDSTIRRMQEPRPQQNPNYHHQHHSHHKHQFQTENDFNPNNNNHMYTYNSDHNTSGSKSENVQQNGIELVPLIVRRRPAGFKATLGSTDVTRGDAFIKRTHVPEPKYLNALTQQVHQKHQKQKAAHVEEVQSCQQHFETWENLWGRPGHGAPRSATQKGRLMTMLYPQMHPMPVH